MGHSTSQLEYRPEIDGLRAIAILPVILFHMDPRWLPGGFIGVDVFFVISGYLITSLVMKELAADRFTLTGFWIRRVRRLMPALTTMILAVLIAGQIVLWPCDWKFLGLQGASALLSSANFLFCSASGNYWAPVRGDMFLLHTWSLSVEEQFYLFYPLLLALLHRHARPRMRGILLAASVASLLLCLIGLTRFPTAAFYMLPMRGWELGVGGLLALRRSGHQGAEAAPASRRILSLTGLVGIALSCFLVTENLGFPGYQALLPVLSTGLVLANCRADDGWGGRVLASRPFVYLGKASYSIYLWHWPVLVFAKACGQVYAVNVSTTWTALLIVVCSSLSYHLVERIGKARTAWRVYVPVLLLACLGLSTRLLVSRPFHDYSAFEKVEWRGRLFDVSPIQQPWTGTLKERMEGIVAPMRAEYHSRAYASGGILRDYGGGVPSVLVLGDSHALMWSSTVDDVCRSLGISVSFCAADGVDPRFDAEPREMAQRFLTDQEQYDFDRSRLKVLTDAKPKVVILVSRWDQLTADGPSLHRFLAFLTGTGATVLLIEQPPVLYFGDRNALQAAIHLRAKWSGDGTLPVADRSYWLAGNGLIHRLASDLPRCRVVRVSDLYEPLEGRARFMDGANLIYMDDDHLSDFGAHLAAPRIRDAIVATLQQTAAGRGQNTRELMEADEAKEPPAFLPQSQFPRPGYSIQQ